MPDSFFDLTEENMRLIKPRIVRWIDDRIAAHNISSNIVGDELPSNVAFLDRAQTFSLMQTLSAGIKVTGGNLLAGVSLDSPAIPSRVYVNDTTTDVDNSTAAIYAQYEANPSAASPDGYYIGMRSNAYSNGSNTRAIGNVIGHQGYGIHYGGGTASFVNGVRGIGQLGGAGAALNILGGLFAVEVVAAGTASYGAGVYVSTPVKTAGVLTAVAGINVENQGLSGITNAYGVRLKAISGATNNYALYSEGGQSYHAGNFGIGDTTPDSGLEIGALGNSGVITLNEVTIATPAANKAVIGAVDVGGATYIAAMGSDGVQRLLYRETLTAARTYYVRTDGSDSNNGLANTAGGAFLTVQKAVNVAAGLDTNVYDVTIQVADGTYNEAVTLKSAIGAGIIIIQGNNSTPANVVINNSSGSNSVGTFTATAVATRYRILDLKITCTGGAAIRTQGGLTFVEFGNLDFGACTNHLQILENSFCTALSNYTISGGGASHVSSSAGLIRIQSITVTISGTPAFSSAFALMNRGSTFIATGITFSGSATGTRYNVTFNSVVDVNGGGANYFPGNAAGTTATGGQYA